MLHTSFELPLTDPVLVFAVVMLVILVSPLLFSRLKVPGIVGLILSGVILGPHGLHVLERDASIILFGTVGLLYLMFMAGLEMDMQEFRRNKIRSIVFGVFTFLFPFALGFVASYYLLSYNVMASVLLASMFSTHTLIAYPVVGRLGITQTRTMAVIVGGTIITDGLVLLILAVITNLRTSEVNVLFFVKLFGMLAVMVFAIMFGVPRLGRWFFRNLESEGYSQYLFVIAVVFFCGFLAHLIGVEPIIGAFLAGLALNQLIPNTSSLMNRIDFAGNALFIPFFLLSVGMLVDVRVLLKGPEALLIALLIIVISFAGKWLAAFFTQKVFRYTRHERRLIWGMSSAHAAATIAVVIIGFRLELLDENVLNGTIILILVSCLGSSIITERAGRAVALADEEQSPPAETEERILVPVANLNNVDRLIDFSVMIKNPRSKQPLLPLYVLQQRVQADAVITRYKNKLHHALKDSAIDTAKEPTFRIDLNVSNGILRAITELRVTDVVIGWNGKAGFDGGFGPILDRVVEQSNTQMMICRLVQPVNTLQRIIAAVPANAEREISFPAWVNTIFQFAKVAGASFEFFATPASEAAIRKLMPEKTKDTRFHRFEKWTDIFSMYKSFERHDALVVVMARRHTRSHHPQMEKVPGLLARLPEDTNIIVLYPSLIFFNN